jgi:5-formyltetrahydrofolate cyclo-ligase
MLSIIKRIFAGKPAFDRIDTLRTRMRKQRAQLSPQHIEAASAQACRKLVDLPEFAQARCIAAYMPIGGEIRPNAAITAAWQLQKRVYMPVLSKSNTLLFAPYYPHSVLRTNRYRIPEPEINADNPAVALADIDIDIIIVPLVAFDDRCQRIGMGAGYYDRTLAAGRPQHPIRIGLAYEFQHIPYVQSQAWDIPMDKIITEQEIYLPRSQ